MKPDSNYDEEYERGAREAVEYADKHPRQSPREVEQVSELLSKELTPSEQKMLAIIQPMLDCDFCLTCPDDAKDIVEKFATEFDAIEAHCRRLEAERDSAIAHDRQTVSDR